MIKSSIIKILIFYIKQVNEEHSLVELRLHPYYIGHVPNNGKCRMRCDQCKEQTSYYCSTCTTGDTQKDIKAFCKVSRGGTCCHTEYVNSM